MIRRLGLAVALLAIAAPAVAQSPLKQSEWLPPGSAVAGDLLERPREALEGGVDMDDSSRSVGT